MQTAHGLFGEQASGPPSSSDHRGSGFSYPPTPADWANIQDTIHQYYVGENLPLNKVRERLKTFHGFRATDRMIKARLAKWEFIKNAKKDDWGYLAVLHELRKQQHKPTVFEIRGHRKTVKDLQRFIRNQNSSPEQFVAEYLQDVRTDKRQIPDYIRAFTPEPDAVQPSPSTEPGCTDPYPVSSSSTPLARTASNHRPAVTYDPSDAFVSYDDPVSSDRDLFRHKFSYESDAIRVSEISNLERTEMIMQLGAQPGPKDSQSFSCHDLQIEIQVCSDQLLNPVPLMSRIGRPEMDTWVYLRPRPKSSGSDTNFTEDLTCSRCHESNDSHFASLHSFEPQQPRNILNDSDGNSWHLPVSTKEEGSWLWISRCFLACMYLTRGDEKLAQAALKSAANEFERRLQAKDSLLLTAAGLMITILHTHDQGEICQRILQSAKAVADRLLPEGDPIRFTISYLTLTANSKMDRELLEEAGFTCASLESVYHDLEAKYPARPPRKANGRATKHPYTIAAHHNLSWILKFWDRLDEAERHAREVLEDSINLFGPIHMQSVTSQCVIAGCLFPPEVKRTQTSIIEFERVVANASQSLGINHPYVLEVYRRLADLYWRLDDKEKALRMHQAVLYGRVQMLGREHSYTNGQRSDYERILRMLGKWQDEDGSPSQEQCEVTELFAPDPTERRGPEDDWVDVHKDEDDTRMVDASDPRPLARSYDVEEAWCREVIRRSKSRSSSPTDSETFRSY